MRLDRELNILHLTAEEIAEAAFCHRHGAPAFPLPCREEGGSAVTQPFTASPLPLSVTARADREGDALTLRFHFGEAEREAALLYCRGVAFLTGALFCLEGGHSALVLRILWEEGEREERVTAGVLQKQAERAVSAFLEEREKEIGLLLRRATMEKAPFPYGSPRPGQRDLILAVHGALKRGKNAILSAPTGTGKTVSTLYPAIRALGRGDVDKIFYLTPKNTSALQAEETVRPSSSFEKPI